MNIFIYIGFGLFIDWLLVKLWVWVFRIIFFEICIVVCYERGNVYLLYNIYFGVYDFL